MLPMNPKRPSIIIISGSLLTNRSWIVFKIVMRLLTDDVSLETNV